ncbi:MFS transporter [Duganella sp. BJB488]|uniref:MFS transporter n=2 Tax=Duganella TaxID=75654 RepID=UPI000E34B6B8|nr:MULTISPECIES: MFS transporter [unclassified Duganella]RFP08803.1 MFS transporter [Duganella sp. BJB489]RFP11577.1 MFS transporter [Duganella sp. BJB488]RFP28532.1 MFS transporter [Duganella sp. BJB480]
MQTPSATVLHLRGAAGMDAIYRKVGWRLLPLLMLCYAVACLDRLNLGYAQRQMQASLAFGDAVYAWGAALFFAGCCLCQLPANLLLEKIGARKTLLRMMLGWGLASAAAAFVRTPFQLYLLRFAQGVFEAGFYPGVILYLTWWYPAARRARVYAVFGSAALLATAGAGPLSEATLAALQGAAGLRGWQWLLLTQGLPAALLGIVAYACLAERPDDAGWLSPFEQLMIEQDLERDEAQLQSAAPAGQPADDAPFTSVLASLLRDRALCLLAAANLLLTGASYALAYWAPALVQRWAEQNHMQPGLLAAIPHLAGVAGMIAIGYDSDRRRERRGHFVACMVLAAGGLALAIAANNGMAWSLAGLALASLGIASAAPLLVAIATDLLSRRRAAAGIALVVSCGLAGGAFGPALGARMQAWGGSAAMLAVLIAMYLAAGAILLLALRLAPRRGGPDARHGRTDKMARY